MSAYLKRLKKADLETLAEETGMTGDIHQALRKDLVETLDLHLQTLPPSQRNKQALQPYYLALTRADHRENSPIKKETTSEPAEPSPEPAKSKEKRPARRKTLTAAARENAESAADAASTTATKAKSKTEGALSRTPKSFQKFAANVPLPSSPQAVTDLIERGSARFTNSLSQTFERSGIPKATESTRAQVSSVQSVTVLLTFLEAATLNYVLIPYRHAFDLPLPVIGPLLFGKGNNSAEIKFPDLFVLLTSKYWAPVSLWLMISLIMPSIAGWLFNFTTKSRKVHYEIDPVVFNAVKGLATWAVFVMNWQSDPGAPAGIIDQAAKGTVAGGLFGGVPGLFVASLIGVGSGVWEGVIRAAR